MSRPPHHATRTPPAPRPTSARRWRTRVNAWTQDLTQPAPDGPEVRRVKLSGYAFAGLAATPGLLMLLRELIIHRAWVQAATHGAVLLGATILLVWSWNRPRRIAQAERILAGLLTLSAMSFLIMYAAQPEQILKSDLLGSVLLFIVTGLLLILPSRLSIPVSLILLVAYRAEVNMLSGIPREQLLLSQWVNTGMFALLTVGVIMRQTLASLNERLHLLEELSNRDALTGLLNRRGFEAQVLELRAGARSGALLVLDIDHFKVVNDTHGHVEGDRVLNELGVRLRDLTPHGVAARWGGEEFVLYLPDATPQRARMCAETVRASVATQPMGGASLAITVSVGCSIWEPGENLHHAFLQADDALYAAKRGGRNRVHLAGPTGMLPARHAQA